MTTSKFEKINIWAFPDFQVQEIEECLMEVEKQKQSEEEAKLERQRIHEEMMAQERATALAEIEKIKQEYEGKLKLVNDLLVEFENPLRNMGPETVELLQYIIKKTVKNIIYKEIKADAKIVKRVIKELEELINAQNGMITVYLSEEDHKRMKGEKDSPSMIFKINPALTNGDVIVKSNYTEIRAILNDRINQILGIKYV